MNDYAKQVVNKLLDKYEKSVISKGGTTRNLQIKIKNTTTEPLFKPYNNGANRLQTQAKIETVLAALAKKNILTLTWHNSFIQDVVLNLDALAEAYAYVERQPKAEKDHEVIMFLNEQIALNAHQPLINFAARLITNISEYRSDLTYYKDITDLKLTVTCINELCNNEKPILLRNFSEQTFGDSKQFETHQSYFLKLFQEFDDDSLTSFDELCAKYNIFKNPPYLYIKNGLTYQVNNQIIDLDAYKFEMSISFNALEIIEILSMSVTKVITIENLTTFNYYEDSEALLIYAAGFPGREVVTFINKIAQFNNGLKWYHFGDIDVNGLRILQSLRAKTGQGFSPIHMDISTLKQYKQFVKPLTSNDVTGLQLLLDDAQYCEFYELIKYMLEHKIKLEQEAVL